MADQQQQHNTAKEWLEANTPLRWTTEAVGDEKDIPLDELNARCDKWADRLAQYAAEQVAAERTRIADELHRCLTQPPKGYRVAGIYLPPDPMPSPCDLLFSSVRNLIEQLRGNDNDGK